MGVAVGGGACPRGVWVREGEERTTVTGAGVRDSGSVGGGM